MRSTNNRLRINESEFVIQCPDGLVFLRNWLGKPNSTLFAIVFMYLKRFPEFYHYGILIHNDIP